MSMSRKDYVAIAAALQSSREVAAAHNVGESAALIKQGINIAAAEIARALAADNGRFDMPRFLAASGAL